VTLALLVAPPALKVRGSAAGSLDQLVGARPERRDRDEIGPVVALTPQAKEHLDHRFTPADGSVPVPMRFPSLS
jgi:hypothetical protein